MRRDLGLLRLARVEPPLAGQRDHSHEGLGVHRRGLGVEPALLELGHQDVLDLARRVTDQTGESPRRLRHRRVAYQDPEAVAGRLDVIQQRQRRVLEQLTRVGAARQRTRDAVEQTAHLTVHHDGVQPFLAAEVLIDDRLGDPRLGGDLLHRGALEPALGEQRPPDVE